MCRLSRPWKHTRFYQPGLQPGASRQVDVWLGLCLIVEKPLWQPFTIIKPIMLITSLASRVGWSFVLSLSKGVAETVSRGRVRPVSSLNRTPRYALHAVPRYSGCYTEISLKPELLQKWNVMPECRYRASSGGYKPRFPLKPSGNDTLESFIRILFLVYIWIKHNRY